MEPVLLAQEFFTLGIHFQWTQVVLAFPNKFWWFKPPWRLRSELWGIYQARLHLRIDLLGSRVWEMVDWGWTENSPTISPALCEFLIKLFFTQLHELPSSPWQKPPVSLKWDVFQLHWIFSLSTDAGWISAAKGRVNLVARPMLYSYV